MVYVGLAGWAFLVGLGIWIGAGYDMGTLRQSKAERIELNDKWQAHPLVVGLRAALLTFIRAEGLTFDANGLTRTALFTQQWTKEHGPLPESGIWTG